MIAPSAAGAQEGGLDPASLTAPLEASWPTYSGDYTGRRYSKLTQVNTETVKHLTLAWTVELNTGMPPLTGTRRPGLHRGARAASSSPSAASASRAPSCRWATCCTSPPPTTSGPSMRGTAPSGGTTSGRPAAGRTSATAGRPSGATRSSSRRSTTTWCRSTCGPARSAGTPRSRASRSSTSRPWRRSSSATTCSSARETTLDAPGFLQSFDPATGERQWIFYTVPMKPGDPRAGDMAEPGRGPRTAAGRSGCPASTTPRRTTTSSARGTRRRATRVWRGPATTCSPAR